MSDLLKEAAEEITRLRRINEVLGAKVETMNLFALVLNTRPNHQECGYSPDIVYALMEEHRRQQTPINSDFKIPTEKGTEGG